MSASAEIVSGLRPSSGKWALWSGQIAAILRLEVRKNFMGKRAILIYLLAAFPILLMAALSAELSWQQSRNNNIGEINIIFANLYEGLILRTIVFFGCAWVFMNLFRGEVVDRSLHYYFLAPVRREVLVVGKYLSGLIATTLLFSITTIGSMLILYFSLYPSESARYFMDGAGAAHLLAYLGVTILACIGYGAVFLL